MPGILQRKFGTKTAAGHARWDEIDKKGNVFCFCPGGLWIFNSTVNCWIK